MKRLFAFCAAALIIGVAPSASGQDWDSTGNGLLNGTYNFREVRWITSTANDVTSITSAVSRVGTISFNGAGTYSINGTEYSSSTGTSTPFVVTNASYSIARGGFGFLNPPASESVLGRVYGLVSNGIFIGSSTESEVNNLFIAAKQSATPFTNQTFNQPYTLVYTNLGTINREQIRDAVIPISPNGGGSLGAVNATGYVSAGTSPVNQQISSASYSFSNGIGTLNLGGSGDLISGNKQLYVAEGGQFVFGGSTSGWDMFVGIRTPTSVPDSVFTDLYFQAGIDIDRTAAQPTEFLNAYFGSFNAVQLRHKIVGHQRTQTAPRPPYEYTYGNDYTLASDGTYDDHLKFRNFVSADGGLKVGFGQEKYLGINVSVKAPTLIGTGNAPFLNPNAVVNAASYSPFTTGLSPGELITLFGTNLAPPGTNLENGTFPSSLGGVSVSINGQIAPIYIARPDGLAVLVPYSTSPGSVAEIVVNNNGQLSNRVTMFVNTTSPGFFATPEPNGLGYIAARHSTRPDLGIVTANDPARPGEYLGIFLTGLGPVAPPITTGQAGPTNPLSVVTTPNIYAIIDGKELPDDNANFNYRGIAPVLHGTYQVNIRVPNDAADGDLYLDLGFPDALNSQIQIPVRREGVAPRSLRQPDRSRPHPPQTSTNTRRGLGEAVDSTSSGSPSGRR